MCHIFLVLPIIALPVFWFLPWQQAVLLYAAVCLVSGGFYWLMWGTMSRPAATGIEGMIGGIGTVFRYAEGKTKVFYRGEIWDAVSKDRMSPDERVEIIGVDRMKLVVRHRA
jgi:inner membrane protein